MLAIGLFADNPIPLDTTNGRKGLFRGEYDLSIFQKIFTKNSLNFWVFRRWMGIIIYSKYNGNLFGGMEFYIFYYIIMGNQFLI